MNSNASLTRGLTAKNYENLIQPFPPTKPGLTLDEIERRAIINALDKAGGNQTKAAKLLDIPRHVLIYRMKKLGVG